MHTDTAQRTSQNFLAEPKSQATSWRDQRQGLATGAEINTTEQAELFTIAVLGYN